MAVVARDNRERAKAERIRSCAPLERRPWANAPWEDLPKWQRLCLVLEQRGPMTTGALGHILGIGENVRGIRREANSHLRTLGWEITSEPTTITDARGRKIVNATYRLVDREGERRQAELEALLTRSHEQISQRAGALQARLPL